MTNVTNRDDRPRPPKPRRRALLLVTAATAMLAAVLLGGQLLTPPSAPAPTPTATAPLYDDEQLENAAAIISQGDADHIPEHGIRIAVMTAMGESGLHNLHHGDTAGPDSVGLFQQRDIWGARTDRLKPSTSAHLFYTHLLNVTGWQTMTPTLAAHAVQINADPNHYTPFWKSASALVADIRHHHQNLLRATPM